MKTVQNKKRKVFIRSFTNMHASVHVWAFLQNVFGSVRQSFHSHHHYCISTLVRRVCPLGRSHKYRSQYMHPLQCVTNQREATAEDAMCEMRGSAGAMGACLPPGLTIQRGPKAQYPKAAGHHGHTACKLHVDRVIIGRRANLLAAMASALAQGGRRIWWLKIM